MGRKRVHDDKLRLRLLDRAGELLAEGGADALGLRSLAKAADTSTSAVYSLFGGKDELLHALYEEGFRRLAERLRAVPADDDIVEHLVRLSHAYRASALEGPHYYRAMFDRRRTAEEDDAVRRAGHDAFEPLLETVRQCVEQGRLVDADPTLVASALWAHVHGLVSLELSNLLPDVGDDMFERAIRAGLSGWQTTTTADR
ncbi:TetR family transcriptional regulator [Saccharopolyspora erythraea NRRL 2338]|nr:TetR/AcrR family transcriptional regulator [Saccharopolyspora erythraea]EQD87996.1 TetR family transcriptional regulator [Saccharopolyspora erythraea D]PFG93165.1 TetR family transcriptional regulator [Saccharopolyspora erythraea NRRL 2338]QRK90027.1 TetR/AcrR family transcriptional regulator [Saccharopolyspora erythraea]